MLRILFVAPSGRFQGGVERVVHDLGEALGERGHRVTLATPADAPRDDAFLRPFAGVVDLADLEGAARDADVVYAHKPIEAPALVRAAEIAPVLVAVHDHDLTCARRHRYLPLGLAPCHDAPSFKCVARGCCVVRGGGPFGLSLKDPFALREGLASLARVARFHAVSHYLADGLVEAGVPRARIEVVHPSTRDAGAPPITAAPAAHELLFAGQIVRGKGLDVLVRAMVGLDARLTVAGDGPGRADAEALARELGVADRVRFLGAVAPRDMPAVYDAARIVVVPSRWPEPFGMIGVEAMRRGRVVVGARHGGIPEWLDEGRGGFGFTPGDAQALHATLARALRAKDYEARAARGIANAAGRFGFARMVSALEATLTRSAALGEARARRRQGAAGRARTNASVLTSSLPPSM